MSTPLIQDLPPKDGFPNTIKYTRNLPRRGPSGAVVLAAVFALMTFGFVKTAEGNAERRELRREKQWARINLVPLLQAEVDRDIVRREELVAEREAKIMAQTPVEAYKGWKAMDLKERIPGIGVGGTRVPITLNREGGEHSGDEGEPVYHTKRHVQPTLIFLPKESPNLIGAQWWRGSTVLTKNPAYQDRSDFTKEHPIGK